VKDSSPGLAPKDQFDTVDFSDNEIRKLGNFPRCARLKTLLLNNNYVTHIDATLGEQVVNLETLMLTNNRIANLSELNSLAGCRKLTMISLLGNPVIFRQHYRLYLIHTLPQLKSIDFRKITAAERRDSKALFVSEAGASMLQDVESERRKAPKPEEALNGDVNKESDAQGDGPVDMDTFTEEQKATIQEMIANASTPEEIDRIEKMLVAGRLPDASEKPPEANGDQPGAPSGNGSVVEASSDAKRTGSNGLPERKRVIVDDLDD